eukprot:gene7515-9809_t
MILHISQPPSPSKFTTHTPARPDCFCPGADDKAIQKGRRNQVGVIARRCHSLRGQRSPPWPSPAHGRARPWVISYRHRKVRGQGWGQLGGEILAASGALR